MGLFDLFKTKKDELSWEDENTYKGATPNCPNRGTPLTKRYVFSEMYCENCRYGLDDISNDMEDELQLMFAMLL